MLANPALLSLVWVERLKQRPARNLRNALGWFSLILATVALLIFWIGMGTSPEAATPAFDRWFTLWFRACLVASAATLVLGLAGLGKRQWIVVLSAFITPLSCVLQKVLE